MIARRTTTPHSYRPVGPRGDGAYSFPSDSELIDVLDTFDLPDFYTDYPESETGQ